MDVQLLSFPQKSHRKVVILPKENSILLAELLGIIYGDGGIGNPWQLVISLNAISDLEYSYYITQIIKKLFGIKPAVKKRPNQNTLIVVLTSTTIIDFLVNRGAVRGNKISQIHSLPSWIQKNANYSQKFVRGLMDTDGCIYHHRHCTKGKNYVNIGICFTNSSPDFVQCVNSILMKYGLRTHITDQGKRIYLYGNQQVEKYLEIFGSSNKRIIDKYITWRDARAV